MLKNSNPNPELRGFDEPLFTGRNLIVSGHEQWSYFHEAFFGPKRPIMSDNGRHRRDIPECNDVEMIDGGQNAPAIQSPQTPQFFYRQHLNPKKRINNATDEAQMSKRHHPDDGGPDIASP